MKIQTKIILVIIFSCTIIFAAFHLAASNIILPSYQDIENNQTQKGVNQALTTLNYRLSQLQSRAIDYAAWDDTYDFVQSYNQEYADANLDTAFDNLNLNIIATIDNSDNLVYCKSYDVKYSSPVNSNQETINQLQSDQTIWNFQSVDDLKSGIILLDNRVTLIATAPVTTSQKDGPILGGMLFGNYLDNQEIRELSEIMGLNFTVSTISDFEDQADNVLIAESLKANPQVVLVKASSSDIISGYTLVNDIHDNPLLILQVNQNREAYRQGIFTRNVFVAAAFMLSVFFGVLMTFILKNQLITPLTNLTTYVKTTLSDINNKKPNLKLATDEVSVLAGAIKDSFNQKLDTMNEVSRMVAHDLRNPLTGIKGAAYSLKKNYSQQIGEKGTNLLKVIDDCVEYSNKIVSDLLDYSGEIKIDKIKTTPYSLVCEVLSTLVVHSNIKILNLTSNEELINVDPAKMKRVFSNIIKNAFDAMPNGGTLTVTSNKLQEGTEINFVDTGVGMPEEVAKKIGTPFFTTKAKGMGVGVSICRRILEAHHGRMQIKSTQDQGTKISVFLP
jgi:signal transduction histidine kinase